MMNLAILLQVAAPTAEEIQQRRDSIHEGAKMMIAYAKENPEDFWQEVLDKLAHFGIQLLIAILIFVVGWWLIKLVQRALKRIFTRHRVEPTLASFINSFVSITLTVVLIVISIGTLGVNTTSVAALLAAGGMAVGMALSGTLQNFAGGLMLLAFKPFKAGDFIEAQGHAGTVIEVNITATKILTKDNRVVILPNGILSNGTINNFSGRPLRRVEWEVSVSYGVDAAACKEAIMAIINSDKRVLQADTNMNKLYKELHITQYQLSTVNYRMDAIPAPFVALKSLNSSDITFVARAWVRGDDYWDVFFDLQERFYTELPPQGFTFAYPHIELVKEENA
jgi:small conductance mechanosensitive channel